MAGSCGRGTEALVHLCSHSVAALSYRVAKKSEVLRMEVHQVCDRDKKKENKKNWKTDGSLDIEHGITAKLWRKKTLN